VLHRDTARALEAFQSASLEDTAILAEGSDRSAAKSGRLSRYPRDHIVVPERKEHPMKMARCSTRMTMYLFPPKFLC
jgi:hypothetical protein